MKYLISFIIYFLFFFLFFRLLTLLRGKAKNLWGKIKQARKDNTVAVCKSSAHNLDCNGCMHYENNVCMKKAIGSECEFSGMEVDNV